MKRTIVIIGLCVAIMGHALAQTNQISTNAPVKALPVAAKTKPFVMPNELTTRSGKTYRDIKLQRVNPSEINITYFDDDGVMQLEDIKLADLPDGMQKAFGYDPKKAIAYDEKQKERLNFLPHIPL